jgi:hypothetical protein
MPIYQAEGFMAVLAPYLLLKEGSLDPLVNITVYYDNAVAVMALNGGRGVLL